MEGGKEKNVLSQCSHQSIDAVFTCRVHGKTRSFGKASYRRDKRE